MFMYPETTDAHADLLMIDFDNAFKDAKKNGMISKSRFIDLFASYQQLRNKISNEKQLKESVSQSSVDGIQKTKEILKTTAKERRKALREILYGAKTPDQRTTSGSESEAQEPDDKRVFKGEDLARELSIQSYGESSESHGSHLSTKIQHSEPQFPILSYWIPHDQVEHVKTLKNNFEAVHQHVNSRPTAAIPSYFYNLLYQSYMKLSDKLLIDLPTINTASKGTQVDLLPTVVRQEGPMSVPGGHDIIHTEYLKTSPERTLTVESVNQAPSISDDDVVSIQQRSDLLIQGFPVEMQNVPTFDNKRAGKVAEIGKIIAANQDRIRTLNSPSDIKSMEWVNASSTTKKVSSIVFKFATAKQANEVIECGLLWGDNLFYCRKYPHRGLVQCKNCQVYGHDGTQCKSLPICAFCAAQHPTRGCRIKTMRCALCGGNHGASSELCQKQVDFKNSLKFWPEEPKYRPRVKLPSISTTLPSPAPPTMEFGQGSTLQPQESSMAQFTHEPAISSTTISILNRIEELKLEASARTPHTSSSSLPEDTELPSAFVGSLDSSVHRQNPQENALVSLNPDRRIAEKNSRERPNTTTNPSSLSDGSESRPADFW